MVLLCARHWPMREFQDVLTVGVVALHDCHPRVLLRGPINGRQLADGELRHDPSALFNADTFHLMLLPEC
ncbi:MAG: hypothetical protein E5V71_10145 [Mesorhizobium sp.]|nr:MAG: hypothetical protein E5V71_10145 [Mesorhizobium sp.]